MFLSVIIPTKNAEMTLTKCLDSILHQSFKDFEVILVDNLSADGTLSIIEHYRKVLPQMRCVSEADKGIYEAMNKGIRMANGDYLYFIGSDDKLFDDNVLVALHALITSERQYDVIYGNVSNEQLGSRYDGEFTKEKLLVNNICHQGIFFKKSVFLITGLFNPLYKSHADWDHNLKWMRHPKIEKRFFDRNIAHFGSNGFSSSYHDAPFEQVLKWENIKSNKKKIPLYNRLRLWKFVLFAALRSRNYSYAIKVLGDALSFLP